MFAFGMGNELIHGGVKSFLTAGLVIRLEIQGTISLVSVAAQFIGQIAVLEICTAYRGSPGGFAHHTLYYRQICRRSESSRSKTAVLPCSNHRCAALGIRLHTDSDEEDRTGHPVRSALYWSLVNSQGPQLLTDLSHRPQRSVGALEINGKESTLFARRAVSNL